MFTTFYFLFSHLTSLIYYGYEDKTHSAIRFFRWRTKFWQ
jgi:hypothetical protein